MKRAAENTMEMVINTRRSDNEHFNIYPLTKKIYT